MQEKNDLKMLFRKIRAGDFAFHESQWGSVSASAKRLIARLLVVNPDNRCTAAKALESEWIKANPDELAMNNLSQSLTSLKKMNQRTSWRGAISAVKFAKSAGFWNSENVTFSRQAKVSDKLVNEAMSATLKFHDKYDVQKEIRKGSCATVYECIHKDTMETLAVKIIKRSKLDKKGDEFILNEVAIMQSLSKYGDHVVQLLDFYEEEEYFYLVMDYMRGGDVFDRVLDKEGGKYSESDARKLTSNLLKAAHCMHLAGVAHRDLKPQNLLLESDENDFNIKIIDFGFARRVHTPQSLTSRCGTVSWIVFESSFIFSRILTLDISLRHTTAALCSSGDSKEYTS